jgi:hypothetical protein
MAHIHHLINEVEAKALKLDSYVMHIHTQICQNCSCGERFSQLFEVWTHPDKTRTTGFRKLQPAQRLDHSLDVAFIELPEAQIPICSDCVDQYEIRPEEKPIRAISRLEWEQMLKRKHTPAPAPSQSTKPAPPTLDQL